jgi:deoxyribodipyrimidine photolyase-related protein
MKKTGIKRIFLILGDQLSESHPFLQMKMNAETDRLLMIESLPRADWLPYHPQKLMYVFSCMRRFALETKSKEISAPLDYVEFSPQTFTEVINSYGADEINVVEPSEPRALDWLKADLKSKCIVYPNEFFLADDKMLPAKPPYLLETFYRAMRTKHGVLMDNGKPLGGQWNFDEDNRRPPLAAWDKQPPSDFLERDWCDSTDIEIYTEVEKRLREHLPSDRFGVFKRPTLPTHASSARHFLKEFISKRLDLFGPYEDAMIAGSVGLFHSGLSPLMNLQILSPHEILQAAEAAPEGVSLASREGFVRQILGWREFLRLIYRRHREDYKQANFFGFTEPLPPLYWGHPTQMNCLGSVVGHVKQHAYSHHITRLMVLGNFALLAHVDPHEVNRWFWAVYLDAYEWVVTPNVLGMSQFADGGVFATKPYVSGANYINKMSLFCKSCKYDPKKTLESDACPFNAMYWDFIATTKENQASRPSFARRMGMMWSVWEKKSDEEKKGIRKKAAELRKRARAGEL